MTPSSGGGYASFTTGRDLAPARTRRDGTVLDRAAGVAIGRVFRESGGPWNHSLNGLVYYRWPTRRQAADGLLRIHRRSQAPGGREGAAFVKRQRTPALSVS